MRCHRLRHLIEQRRPMPARERRHDYAVQSRSASRVEYLEARSLKAIILKYCRDQSRRTISQPRQLRFKASREAVKGRFNETVRCAQLCHRTTNRTSAFGGRAVVQWTLLQCTGRGPERSCGAFLMRCLFPLKPCYSQSRDLGLAVSSP